MESIGDAWGFSGKTPIAPSGGFSVETLTGVTPSWKTELNRSISTVEDGISGGLQHCHETCCEKGGRCGRWACMVWRWFHHRDVISRQVDLYMTILNNLQLQFIFYASIHCIGYIFQREPLRARIRIRILQYNYLTYILTFLK